MFTGIVEAIGTVSALIPQDSTATGGGGTSLTISNAASILGDVHLGDSIAVNGTCLTVTEFTADNFKVGVAPETLRRTNLGELKVGMGVNLERAVGGDVRFGGHFVQGHVDTTAEILSKTPDGNALTIRFRPNDPSVLRYIVEKGYITLDGASLTLVAVDDKEKWFEVMLVAYTQEKIVIPRKAVGDTVNVEVDMAGKYIEKQVQAQLEKGLLEEGGLLQRLVREAVEKALAEK
ncbi:alpha subunit of riboflavin synthase [Sphaerosporella brunnea]|uniref:Riboflavin synthase n=1 Tax=Sphaerosporella brunnea TaxID=1250544 RepID=A0A5J5EX00_9PEZI|nr:alpha subunit of riboflavin synthase [Sphaerosporella brunnea]